MQPEQALNVRDDWRPSHPVVTLEMYPVRTSLVTRKGVDMNVDETLVKIDCLCSRLEDVLAELRRVTEKKPGPYAKVRETHPNAGKPWSNADDEELRRLFTTGNAVEDLAMLFGRTPNGIRVRLERLGSIDSAA